MRPELRQRLDVEAPITVEAAEAARIVGAALGGLQIERQVLVGRQDRHRLVETFVDLAFIF